MMMIFKLTEVRILLRFHEFSPNALFLFEDRSFFEYYTEREERST